MRTSRTALVTGSAQGIGRAIAERMIANGVEVVLLDVADYLHRTAEEIETVGAVQVDVTDLDALRDAVHGVAGQAGRLDILRHCGPGRRW